MGKVYTLSEAVSKYVSDGDSLAIGGFTTNRKPFAILHEMIRQGKKDFILLGSAHGGDADMLIGRGLVKAYINCYTANSGYTNVSRRFREAIEKGTILFEDYSQDAIMQMLHGAALGLPFIPSRLLMGTDLANKWGISKEVRKTIDKLPDEKFVIQQNPFNEDERLLHLPVPEIDLAIIHVQMASIDGTCRILGDELQDIDIASAAKRVIVTCEELVSNEYIRRDPNLNSIPGFVVDAVVHAPMGAHPSQCYDYYDYDSKYYRAYDVASKTQEAFDAFCEEWIYSTPTHEAYLDKVGGSRLANLKVVPGLGYHIDMTAQAKEEQK